ncbi:MULTISPECIES: wax ester/triacylglycerol synthase family O-acyltransferase [unclassified Nocardia]|uniref:wax ester/triacylglycerol synthase family O-acyltransferase n=1 Tax=unclassified Nocardia TaxID=2637762 RepID=UPI001CE497E4|nr:MULTISPECIES: wax ester/triacylglycerol synthase family O-acyltransferase [unclassified Nocardia]
MTGLGPLDAGFMELEDTDRHVSAGICAVAIVAGAQPGRAELIAALRDHLDADARLRQKVRRARWDLAAPEWVDDPNFDLAHHIRWMALPEPGDDAALNELIASVMEERLDRDHPLWQCIVVERLTGGRWALIVKVHHSMVDGISGITLFERLCEGRQGNSVRPAVERIRSDPLGLLAKGLRLPIDAPKAVLGAVPLIMDAFAPAPDSSLNGPIGRQRRYAVARTSLSAVREIGAAFGATVNDVALAAVAAAFRAVLLARGEEPTPDKLRILAPVSTRATEAKNVLDNRVSAMLPLLPIELADPVAQLAAVHERMARHKRRGEASAANSILELANWLPFASIAWIVRSVLRYPQHSVAGLATNVPGPRKTLRLLGREVLEILAYAPIAMRLRTGIAILSYRDQLAYGITGDFDSTPDIALIAEGIERATAELLARARAVAVPVG